MNKILSVFISLVLCCSIAGCAVLQGKEEPLSQPEPIDYSSAVVSYLGPEGTYTQEACETFFGGEGRYVPYKTVQEAVLALTGGESDYAVIPQENTIGGAVIDYLDILTAQTGVSVTGEVELPISQNLLGLPGTSLSDIRTVYSHKQGIAQRKDWRAENLPEAEVIEVSSTAEGARMVSEGQDKMLASIGSAGCVEVYGLEILAADIQNNDKNKTRFYVLSHEEPFAGSSDRLAFTASGAAEDLPGLMAEMKKLKMPLVTIHDRPLKTELGQYIYVVECSGTGYDSYQKLIKNSPFEFRYLGSFPVR